MVAQHAERTLSVYTPRLPSQHFLAFRGSVSGRHIIPWIPVERANCRESPSKSVEPAIEVYEDILGSNEGILRPEVLLCQSILGGKADTQR